MSSLLSSGNARNRKRTAHLVPGARLTVGITSGALLAPRRLVHAVLGSGDRSSVPKPTQGPTDNAHRRSNRGGDANLERCAFNVIELHEVPKTLETSVANSHHHFLPVRSTHQIVE